MKLNTGCKDNTILEKCQQSQQKMVSLRQRARLTHLHVSHSGGYKAFDQQKKLKEQENDGLLDSKQVMELLNVKYGTLWRWNRSGYLTFIKIGSRSYWKREDVYEILEKREEKK